MSTPGKRKKSSKAAANGIGRAFDPKIFKRAEELAEKYRVVLQAEEDFYFGNCLEIPTVMGDGPTPDECVKSVRKALTVTLAYLLETHQPLPSPASEQTRSVQVNIRFTAEEKLRLEQSATQQGFRGVSDYIRHSVLSSVN